MANKSYIKTLLGIYGFVGLLNEYFSQNDWYRDVSLLASNYFSENGKKFNWL